MAAKTTTADLQKELSGLNNEYQASDEAALKAQTEETYNPVYEGLRQDLANSLANQQAEINREVYDFGMQRSSYNPAVSASLQGGYERAQAQLDTAHKGSMASVLLDALNNEYQRKTAADQYRDNLLLQLYQFDHPTSSGGGGGGGGTTPANTVDVDPSKQKSNVTTMSEYLKTLNIKTPDTLYQPISVVATGKTAAAIPKIDPVTNKAVNLDVSKVDDVLKSSISNIAKPNDEYIKANAVSANLNAATKVLANTGTGAGAAITIPNTTPVKVNPSAGSLVNPSPAMSNFLSTLPKK